MSSRKSRVKAPLGLAQGQLWKLNHLYIHIVELGKRMIHYRMLSDVKDPGARIKTSSVDVLWRYLQSRHARLVNSMAGQ